MLVLGGDAAGLSLVLGWCICRVAGAELTLALRCCQFWVSVDLAVGRCFSFHLAWSLASAGVIVMLVLDRCRADSAPAMALLMGWCWSDDEDELVLMLLYFWVNCWCWCCYFGGAGVGPGLVLDKGWCSFWC